MANSGLTYAEGTLGVHTVYEAALAAQALLETTTVTIVALRARKRAQEELIADREMEIVSDERGRHTDLSQAALDRHLKEVFRKDESLKLLRLEHEGNSYKLDSEEYDLKSLESEIKIQCARMTELGGYFNYLVQLKVAATQSPQSQTSTKADQTGTT